MSGSNSLAAAKRRRGGSIDNKGPPPPGSTRTGQPSPQSAPPGGPVNPLQLVMMNHQRLNNLQNDLPKAIDSLGENFNALSTNCDFLHEQFTSLREEFQTLKNSTKSVSNVSNVSPSNPIDNEKLNKINEDLSDAHKVVSKLQSFSMETSTSLSKLKEEYNSFSSSVIRRLDDLDILMSMTRERSDQYILHMNNRLSEIDNILSSLKEGTTPLAVEGEEEDEE